MRRLLPAAVAAALLALAACGSPSSEGSAPSPAGTVAGADASAFPVTIEHALGTTTIPEVPQRVATLSWVNADVALALGVVPVGMARDDFGGTDAGSTPWKDARLAELGASLGTDAAPAQYSEVDGPAYSDLARLRPDVILAAYSGITQEQYDKLSEIAPVVAYPQGAWATPWQETTRLVGEALGRSEQAEELVATTERAVADAAAEHPALEGTTFIASNIEPGKADGIGLYTAIDNRPRFLTSLGMRQADVVTRNSTDGAFYVPWSPDRADELDADVVLTWVADESVAQAIADDPLLRRIPAVAAGTLVTQTDATEVLSISAASPLSLPWALDRVVPKLAEAAEKAGRSAS